jgi:hypothetical protein
LAITVMAVIDDQADMYTPHLTAQNVSASLYSFHIRRHELFY